MNDTVAIHNATDQTTHCRVGQHRWVSTYDHQAHLPTWTCQHCGEVKVKVADQNLFYVWASHR